MLCLKHQRRRHPRPRQRRATKGHFEHFDGGYPVGFETYSADADLAPFFKGLPNDECQCEHWGYVVKGKVKFTSADGTRRDLRDG